MGLGNATWARRWAWRPRAQAAPLTLEHRLLLACARPVPEGPRLQALVARGPDWPWLLRQVERWGLAPLVYTHLQPVAHAGHVPQSVLERLRHLSHRDTIYGVAQRQVLRATLVGLAEAGVPVIVLKGAALAALVYPAPALRPMRDLDLLVQPRDRARVEAVLRRLREAPAAGSDAPHGSSALGPERFAPLDIRDHLVSPRGVAWLPAAGAIPIADVWQRARPAQIVSVATLVLSPEDLLLHLALQLAEAGGFVGHVRTLCDIGATCWRYGEAIDWWALGTRATTYQVGKALYYCLRLARELVGADVPGGALTELRARCGHLPLEERFLAAVTRRALLAEGPATGLPARCYRLGMHLLATQRARDGVTVAWRLLGRAGQGRLRRLGRGPGLWPPHVAGAGDSGESALRPQQTPARPTSPREHPSHSQGEVAVTYDQNQADGVGAQLQRIYGLYALSRALDIKYVHTPLGRVDYQGLMPLLAGRTDPDFATRYNAFFSLPSDDFDVDGCERLLVPYPNEKLVEHYRQHAAATGRPVLLRAHEPYGYTDRHPEAYRALHAVSPYRDFRPEGPIRICIHVRRGDAVMARDPRLLSNAYFLRVCGTVVNALQQQRASFAVRLHTEMPPRPYTLHPGLSGLYCRLDQPSTLDPAAHALGDFEALPNLEIVLNVEPREALDDFATADVLILSLSCFGYLGGLLNPHGLVIAAPNLPWPQNFHTALPDWLVAGEHGDLDAAQVATRIADQLRRRSQWSNLAKTDSVG